jgi:CheY-like chemotaxis protein
MKKIFVVVEDTKKEQDRAVMAILKGVGANPENMLDSFPGMILLTDVKATIMVASHMDEAIRIMDTLPEMQGQVGVLTDLMMPRQEGNAVNPNGLSIIAACVQRDLPVVLCSDIHHHDADYLIDVFRVLKDGYPNQRIDMVIDSKDWDKAVSLL